MDSDKIKINLGGDVVLADLFERYGCGLGTKIKKDSFDPFCNINHLLSDADINIINLEAVLSDQSNRKFPWSEIMKGQPSSVKLLKKNYITAVNLANNHSLDHGRTAYEETLKSLEEEDIICFGGPRDYFQFDIKQIVIKGKKILLAGYYIEESLSISERNTYLQKVLDNIDVTKNKDCFMILSLHWGVEYVDNPTSWMIEWGKRLIDAGVNIVFGHHSHTFQGVALYGDGIFAPSMGNLVIDEEFKDNRITSILQVEILDNNVLFKTIPVFIDPEGKPAEAKEYSVYIEQTNNTLRDLLRARLNPAHDSIINRKSRKGHIMNRLKIRKNVLYKPVRYIPFLFNYGH